MSDNDDLFSSDDDDLILELTNKPPKFTQVVNETKTNDITSQQPLPHSSVLPPTGTKPVISNEIQDKLNKAQGEASMLRDKIDLLNKDREKERIRQKENDEKVKNENAQEMEKLKQMIQRLEDEKKFLVLETKSLKKIKKRTDPNKSASHIELNKANEISSSFNSTVVDIKSVKSSPMIKKRKITQDLISKINIVQLDTNPVITDETNQIFDKIMGHRLNQCDMTTVEILHTLKLGYIKSFSYKDFNLKSDQSIGEGLVKLMLLFKGNMSLDKFIDIMLETIARLIKEISFDEKETNLAIPFLVVIMFQIISFRPSAVHYLALKDSFLFLCDLIKNNQHVLKKSSQDALPNLYVEPQVFQYEMIDDLIICYSCDTLEMILRVLQTHNNKEEYSTFLDESILSSIEELYMMCFPISFKPILNVIFNMVEILNILLNLILMLPDRSVLSSSWWEICLLRLYTFLGKTIKNYNKSDVNDLTSFTQKRYFDVAGLIRNIGNNSWSSYISELIHKDKLQFLPRVICKDKILKDDNFDEDRLDFGFEKWLINLKDDILNILENLLQIYDDDEMIADGDMLIHLTKLLAREQEELLEIYIGQDNPNVIIKVKFVEHIIRLLYQLLIIHGTNVTDQHIKLVESELITALWRILVSQVDDHLRSHDDMNDHRHLVDKLNELKLVDDKLYYEDTFEDLPKYIEEELADELEERTYRMMQIKYDKVYQEMARNILEARLGEFTTMTEVDSLYAAMGM